MLVQVLFFIGLLEIPFLIKLREGSIDGTGDLAFDPAQIKQNTETYYKNQVSPVLLLTKNVADV